MFLSLIILAAAGYPQRPINLTVHNTSRFHVEAEVKCDWNKEARRYGHYQKVAVLSRGHKNIQVPRNVKDCEVWPQVNIWR